METVSSSNTNMDKAEIDNFYASVPMKDLELLVGPTVARSRSNSPVNEAHDSPAKTISTTENFIGLCSSKTDSSIKVMSASCSCCVKHEKM